MYYLYIIKSTLKDWKYIGITNDIGMRIAKHNAGDVQSTKPYRPLKLIYQEQFADKKMARQRELHLKKNAKARKDIFEAL